MIYIEGFPIIGYFFILLCPFLLIKWWIRDYRDSRNKEKQKREQDNTAHYNDLMRKLNADS